MSGRDDTTHTSGTSTLSLQARARDIVSGAFSGAAQVILSNATTSSSIKLLANDGSVDGPNKYLLIGGGAAVISGMYLGVGTTSPFEAFEVRSDGGKGFSVNPDYGGVTWIYAHDRITDTPIPLVIRAANTIMNASNVQVVGTGGVTIGIDATSGGYTALQLQLSAAMGGYSILQSIAASGSSYGTLALNPSGGAVAVNSSTASYALDVNGAAHASSFPTSSDARFKEALAPLLKVLDRVTKLGAYNFYWRRNYAGYDQFLDDKGQPLLQIGFVAQEVEQEFPELISRWSHTGRDGIKTADAYSVDYARMVPVLVQAIRELRAEVAALEARLN